MGQIIVAVGTSLAKTHEHYAARLKLLTSCWKEVNAEDVEADVESAVSTAEGPEEKDDQAEEQQVNLDKAENAMGSMEQEDDQKKRGSWQDNSKMNIPKTFAAMARFNAAVMGTGEKTRV